MVQNGSPARGGSDEPLKPPLDPPLLLVRLSRLRYALSTFIRACKSKKQLCAGAGSKPKNSKAWTTAIWHDYTASSRRPSNRRMVVESAMSVAGAGLSEMGG